MGSIKHQALPSGGTVIKIKLGWCLLAHLIIP